MKQQTLYELLNQNLKNVFWFWELNHVIGFTYSAILAAARDEADKVEVFNNLIVWYKEETEINRMNLHSDHWQSDFLRCFQKIFKRDKLIKSKIILITQSETSIIFTFDYAN